MRFSFIIALICAGVLSLAARQIQPSAFHIAIIDGDGALNNVKGRLAREPIVQVEDENHKPVRGAYVEFSSPGNGPSAVFQDGSTHFATTTDEYGRAVAHGLKPNNLTGKFEIHVHVTYQGQPIGDVTIHEANVSGPVANLSKDLSTAAAVAAAALAAGVLGVAAGGDFLVNGSSIPGNANLTTAAHLQTLDKTVTIYLHDQCEFLIAPHSAVTVEPSQLILQQGALRARHFGNCKVKYEGIEVTSLEGTADGVIALTGAKLQVASVDGSVHVVRPDGSVAGTVAPGTVSSYPIGIGQTGAGGSSGATGANPMSDRARLATYAVSLGVVLGGLGLSVDAILQPTPTSP